MGDTTKKSFKWIKASSQTKYRAFVMVYAPHWSERNLYCLYGLKIMQKLEKYTYSAF